MSNVINVSVVTVTSYPAEVVPARDEQLARVEIALLGTILALALLGNGMMADVLRRISLRRKLTRMNRMMAHLTAADIFVAVCHVLPQMAWKITLRFRGPNVLCKLVAYVQVVAMFAAAYVLVATAIDRYIAVCHPLKTHVWTGRRMHLLVAVSWIASLTFALPQLFLFAKRPTTIIAFLWNHLRVVELPTPYVQLPSPTSGLQEVQWSKADKAAELLQLSYQRTPRIRC